MSRKIVAFSHHLGALTQRTPSREQGVYDAVWRVSLRVSGRPGSCLWSQASFRWRTMAVRFLT
jgi:hypothetical protein